MLRPIFVEHVDADCWVERRTCVCQCVVGSEARLLMLSECAEDARESIKVLEIIEPYNQGELQPPRLFVSVITPHNHLDMKLSSLAVLCAAAFVSSTAAGVARRQSGGCECGSQFKSVLGSFWVLFADGLQVTHTRATISSMP